MNEIRKDYLLDRFVIIAEKRGTRPNDFIHEPPKTSRGTCFFCPGNEHLTPPETGRIRGGRQTGKCGGWLARSFYNKFPAVSDEYPLAKGSHEVLVETPEHEKQMSGLSVQQIERVLELYSERTCALEKKNGIKCVSIFKNQGIHGGTSLLHSHSQLIALTTTPPLINDELRAFKKLKRDGRGCVFCKIAGKEATGARKIFTDKNFVAFAPYASRAAYEVWLVPRRHVKSITGLSTNEQKSLALMLKKLLVKLDALFEAPSFNYYLHSAPVGEDFHFHIELIPRLTTWAGFELGSGAYINPVKPETAAKELKS